MKLQGGGGGGGHIYDTVSGSVINLRTINIQQV